MLALLATTTTPHSAMLWPLYLVTAPSPELYKMSKLHYIFIQITLS